MNEKKKILEVVMGQDSFKRYSVLQGLPEEFSTNEALEVAKKHDMSRTSLFTLLQEERFFEKKRHGKYKKII